MIFFYLNPIIFLRPVEYSLNSSDNALMGLNWKFKSTNNSHIYGQFVIDEFSQPPLSSGENGGEINTHIKLEVNILMHFQ